VLFPFRGEDLIARVVLLTFPYLFGVVFCLGTVSRCDRKRDINFLVEALCRYVNCWTPFGCGVLLTGGTKRGQSEFRGVGRPMHSPAIWRLMMLSRYSQ
jgi:hypothetical protein